MAEKDEAGEKQHKATGKRLSELRRKGSVLRSKDLSGGITLLVAILQIIYFSSEFQTELQQNLLLATNSIRNIQVNHELGMTCRAILANSIFFLMPIFIISFITAWLAPFLFGGWNFTFEALHFKFSTLNPLTNLKNIFSPKRAAIEVFKSALKAFLIIGTLAYFIWSKKQSILSLTTYPILMAIQKGGGILINFLMLLIMAVVCMVMLDMFIQYMQYQSQTKMSTQEIKDESKETEGNSDVKRKIRSRQIAMIKQRLHTTVPQATVIITNPTHYAVALRYDENKDHAPKVLAKGKGLIAQQIRYLAVSHGIHIYQEPVLARAIFHTTKTGAEVKSELYMAVAIVLSYVHQLKNYQQGKGTQPKLVNDLKIPEDFIFSE